MNKLFQMLAFLIFTPLIFTGCASSSSIKDEAQLLEYEKCLYYAITTLRDIEIPGAVARVSDKAFRERFNGVLQRCEKFRPYPLP